MAKQVKLKAEKARGNRTGRGAQNEGARIDAGDPLTAAKEKPQPLQLSVRVHQRHAQHAFR